MDITDVAGLIFFFLACFSAALPGAYFRPGEWYEGIAKPNWRPPNWVFGPAWAVLFTTIAIAGWRVWSKSPETDVSVALTIYFVHLLLNAAWSWLYFGLRRIDLAFYEILVLWASILAMIIAFHPIDETASLMLLPYLAWVTFASTLTFATWRMNRVSGKA
jgi:tryptophan-rich sensory protein